MPCPLAVRLYSVGVRPTETEPAVDGDGAAADPAGDVVHVQARRVEVQPAVDLLHAVREREVAQAPVADDQRAEHRAGCRTCPRMSACTSAAPELADVAQQPLQDAEVRVAQRAHREAPFRQVHVTGHLDRVPSPTNRSAVDPHELVFERQPNVGRRCAGR